MALDFGKYLRPQSQSERLTNLKVRSDVVAAATVMATDRRSDPTFKFLGDFLPESEIVVIMMEGRHQKHRGLAVLTTRRVLFMGHSYVGGPLLQIDLDQISPGAAQGDGHRLQMRTMDSNILVDQAMGTSATLFATALNRQLAPAQGPAPRDALVQLAEIRALHDSGVMTDEEFAAEKARLMDQL